MGRAIAVKASPSCQPPQTARLLAVAAVFDGAWWEEAAKIGGMDRQALRDWVIRFGERGRMASSMLFPR
jgi:hypothetical protein